MLPCSPNVHNLTTLQLYGLLFILSSCLSYTIKRKMALSGVSTHRATWPLLSNSEILKKRQRQSKEASNYDQQIEFFQRTLRQIWNRECVPGQTRVSSAIRGYSTVFRITERFLLLTKVSQEHQAL